MNIEELFTTMVEKRASHVHLVPGSPIMMRINNQLESMDGQILSPQDTQAFSEAIMTDQLHDEFDDHMEVDFSFSVPGLSRFRVNVFRQRGSVAVIISTNPPAPPSIEELGIPDSIKNIVTDSGSGLVVVCGPKQCGKSSTMAALINCILAEKTCQVISIEDPIDFLYKNNKGVICQREIGTDVMSYKEAFAALKHQSADVVFISGMDNYETISNAIELAAAGTFVLATSTAQNVPALIEKIIDSYPPHLNQSVRNHLAEGLKAVIGQIMLTKADGKGLVPAFELLLGTQQCKQLLKDNKVFQIHALMAAGAREHGMQTIEMALRSLVKKNIVTMDEAMRACGNSEEFKKIMSLSLG